MRIIHIGDIHASKERYPLVKQIFNQIINKTKLTTVDAILFCGDFWDSTITNTTASHFTDYLDFMKTLSSFTNVIMIYGTPTHEPYGSLDVFSYIGCDVIKSYTPVAVDFRLKTKNKIEIVALPEPRLSLLQGNLEEKYKQNKSIYEVFLNSKDWTIKDNPRLCMFHNEVIGMKYQNGEEIKQSSLALKKDYLKQLYCDYYAGGHIHLPQDLGNGLQGGYCGSAAAINFGETHNAGYVEIEF